MTDLCIEEHVSGKRIPDFSFAKLTLITLFCIIADHDWLYNRGLAGTHDGGINKRGGIDKRGHNRVMRSGGTFKRDLSGFDAGNLGRRGGIDKRGHNRVMRAGAMFRKRSSPLMNRYAEPESKPSADA